MSTANRISKFFSVCITCMIAFNTYGYDGDVDYTAPYVTIDPETGTLVTVDPKTQTKTPHTSSMDKGANTSNTTNAQTTPSIMATSTTAGTGQQTPSDSALDSQATRFNLAIISGVLLAAVAAAFIYRNNKTAPAETTNGHMHNH